MSQALVDKDFRETLKFSFTWKKWLSTRNALGNSTIANSSWAKDPPGSLLTITPATNDTLTTNVTLGGGDSVGSEVDVTNTITTSDGEIAVATLTVRMVKK